MFFPHCHRRTIAAAALLPPLPPLHYCSRRAVAATATAALLQPLRCCCQRRRHAIPAATILPPRYRLHRRRCSKPISSLRVLREGAQTARYNAFSTWPVPWVTWTTPQPDLASVDTVPPPLQLPSEAKCPLMHRSVLS